MDGNGRERQSEKKSGKCIPSFHLVLFLGSIPRLLVLSIAETQLSALIPLNRSGRKSILAATLVTRITSQENNTGTRSFRGVQVAKLLFFRFLGRKPAFLFARKDDRETLAEIIKAFESHSSSLLALSLNFRPSV